MSLLRSIASAAAVLAITFMATRMMQNRFVGKVLEGPVLGIMELLDLHSQESLDSVYVFTTLSLGFLLALALVIGANRLVTRGTRK